ncbi:NUDIX hydrolase [Nocardia takedensis]|uniref:NUDIX hydrolase n=1 Tax=Nocardia takedensis TaxID=259390 RepID=UPI0002F700C2|nr:NUDIX domain-containing protein [Nocardia takedensis]
MAAYVLRHHRGPELLVFDHVGIPEAGTQIPAGGVHPGEDLEGAVRRETAEETGLFDLEVIARLTVDHRPHPESGHPRHTTFFHLRARPETPDSWTHRVAGTDTDASLEFACHFTPLPLTTPLADNQHAWLHLLHP